ncbi:MAG: proton-conducting transporter membrane subunit, partial [Planctomycetota bacterium]
TINATNIQVAAVLLVIAAVVKSAQFPFHTWLPQTMQTPTPVSALMHAGIVNAGGYLIVRLHPVVVAAPWVMAVLAAFGILTVTYAAVVMTTQTSVKRTLAYSTIAQMGFMILQCGLGAFSAAMLHILAHSMYKAHAFLSSGSQIANYATPSLLPPRRESISRGRSISVQLGLFAAGVSLLFGFLMLLGVDPISKPGGLVLGAIIALAVSRWLGQMLQFGDRKTQLRSAIVSVLLLATYGFSYRCVSWFTQNADGLASTSIPVFQWVAIGSIVTLGFVLLLIVELTSSRPAFSSRLQSLYVHASNGFYMDGILRRTFGTLMSS